MAAKPKELLKIAGKFVGFALLTALFEQGFGTRKPKKGKI